MDEPHEGEGDTAKSGGVRRPMNAFLIFCKRHRSLVREKNPQLDNRSVTRILGDLWANLPPDEKSTYINLAKEYKEAFLKANPDYKWYNPDKHNTDKGGTAKPSTRPTNAYTVYHGQKPQMLDGTITPGKLADPSDMGGLSLLLMAGQQMSGQPGVDVTQGASTAGTLPPANWESLHVAPGVKAEPNPARPPKPGGGDDRSKPETDAKKNSLFQLAEMCSNQLAQKDQGPQGQAHGNRSNNSNNHGNIGLALTWTSQSEGPRVKQEVPASDFNPPTDLRAPAQIKSEPIDVKQEPPITMATIAWKEKNAKEAEAAKPTTVKYTELKIPSVPWSKSPTNETQASQKIKAKTAAGSKVATSTGKSTSPLSNKVTSPTNKMLKPRTPTLLSPAGAGLSRMVVDKVIETVYSTGLVLADPPGIRRPLSQPGGASLDKPLSQPPHRDLPRERPTTYQPDEETKLPYTFGEIQETLIRKAVEDSYGVLRNSTKPMTSQRPTEQQQASKLSLSGQVVPRTSLQSTQQLSHGSATKPNANSVPSQSKPMEYKVENGGPALTNAGYFSNGHHGNKAAAPHGVPPSQPHFPMAQPKCEPQDLSRKFDSNGNIPSTVHPVPVPLSSPPGPGVALPLSDIPGTTPPSTIVPSHSVISRPDPAQKTGDLVPVAKKKRKKQSAQATEMGPPSDSAKPKKKRAKKIKTPETGGEGATSPSGSVIKAKKKRKKKVEVVGEVDKNSGSSDPEVAVDGDDAVGTDDQGSQDSDGDDGGVRKSKRSNRGQRYKELISQGIINPMRKKSESSEECREESLNLPAIKRSRKRTVSESSIGSLDGSKRYKTGDFDLEAHIASLPPVSLEPPMGKKHKCKGRTRHLSSQSNSSITSTASESQRALGEILSIGSPASTVSNTEAVPQSHELNIAELKVIRRASCGSEPSSSVPPASTSSSLTGSQKRKARKSSITRLHLISKDQATSDVNNDGGDSPTTPTFNTTGQCDATNKSEESEVGTKLISTCINLKALADMATAGNQSIKSEEQLKSSHSQPIAVTCT